MNILFIGDIVGKVGRKALKENLQTVKEKYDIDFVIANGENISKGKGMSENHYHFLVDIGVDCVTLGNHYKDKDDTVGFLDFYDNICRPLNIKEKVPGVGSIVFDVDGILIRVTNLLGEAYSSIEVTNPYEEIIKIIQDDVSDIHIVDFHAEATGEKKAFAYALRNTVSAVIGTHTHVQTRDAQILKDGVLYISDVGMCGSYNSVLGTEIESVIDREILHKPNAHFSYLDDDDTLFSAVVMKFNNLTFKGESITPLYIINRKGK